MDTAEKYKIELTEYEIEMFTLFRKHQTEFEILNNNGFFRFRNGNMTIHKDDNGKIRKIEVHNIAYRV
jgi:hypothetical protein